MLQRTRPALGQRAAPAKAKPLGPKEVLVAEIRTFLAKDGLKREATNEANRQKTVVGKAMVEWLKDGDKPEGSMIVVDGEAFEFAVSSGSAIPAEKWYELFKKKTITEAQFLQAISVGKSEAKLVLGADRIDQMCVETKGDKAEPRSRTLPKGEADKYSSGVHEIIPKKVTAPVASGLGVTRKLGLKKRG